jgi:Putative zinc-finger
MNCADVEILLAEYVDGTLSAETKAAVEGHLPGCRSCAELARDASAAVEFMERAATVEAPPELVTRILFQIPSATLKPSLARRLFGRTAARWLDPLLQPRFAMGMAMTVLSVAMLTFPLRQLKAADLQPAKLWMAGEDTVSRLWERGVKSYQNLRLVLEIEARLQQWSEEDQGPGAGTQGRGAENGGTAGAASHAAPGDATR